MHSLSLHLAHAQFQREMRLQHARMITMHSKLTLIRDKLARQRQWLAESSLLASLPDPDVPTIRS